MGIWGVFGEASEVPMAHLPSGSSPAPTFNGPSVPGRRLGLLQGPLPPVSMAMLLLALLASSASMARGVEPGDCGDGLDCSIYEDLGVHVDMGGASERLGPPDNSWSDMEYAGQVMVIKTRMVIKWRRRALMHPSVCACCMNYPSATVAAKMSSA